MKHAAIAIGSNLGNSLQIVAEAIQRLNDYSEIEVEAVSNWYQTKAITLSDIPQPDYINGCAILRTTLAAADLLTILLEVEVKFGRVRRAKWDARTLDLDLLLYEDDILEFDNLVIPHPRMCDRAFVMLPLAEIAPNWLHPVKGDEIANLSKFTHDLSSPQLIQYDNSA